MIVVVLTLVAGFFFGLSSVMEQRSTKQVPPRGALSPRLLVDLARRALWLTAIGVNIVGSVLQVVALHSCSIRMPSRPAGSSRRCWPSSPPSIRSSRSA